MADPLGVLAVGGFALGLVLVVSALIAAPAHAVMTLGVLEPNYFAEQVTPADATATATTSLECEATQTIAGSAIVAPALPEEPSITPTISVNAKANINAGASDDIVSLAIIKNGTVLPKSLVYEIVDDSSSTMTTSLLVNADRDTEQVFELVACSTSGTATISEPLMTVQRYAVNHVQVGPYVEPADIEDLVAGGGGSIDTTDLQDNIIFLAGLIASAIASFPLTKAFVL